MYFLARERKVRTILEFGVGKSTIVFGDALCRNKENYFHITNTSLRRVNLYECHAVDNYQIWLDKCRNEIPQALESEGVITLHLARLIIDQFKGRICTFYDPIPNLCPDLIYLDGPDQLSAEGDIRGVTTAHQDRMPMAADLLSFEHFLQP